LSRGKLSRGKLSWGQIVSGQIVSGQIVLGANCPGQIVLIPVKYQAKLCFLIISVTFTYFRFSPRGMMNSIQKSKIERLQKTLCAKSQKVRNCLIWTGAISSSHYGVISRQKKLFKVHRVAYAICKNLISFNTDHDGLMILINSKQEISHLCHNRLCINVDHLSLEPHAINNQRLRCKNNLLCSGNHKGFQNCLLNDFLPGKNNSKILFQCLLFFSHFFAVDCYGRLVKQQTNCARLLLNAPSLTLFCCC